MLDPDDLGLAHFRQRLGLVNVQRLLLCRELAAQPILHLRLVALLGRWAAFVASDESVIA